MALGGIGQGENGVHTPLRLQPSVGTSDSVGHEDHVDGTFEFGGIRVKLVTYKSIPGVVQVNASKTMSEWKTLRGLNLPTLSDLKTIILALATGCRQRLGKIRLIRRGSVSYTS